MSVTVSLEYMKELAAQLPPLEQLKLVAHISERLTEAISLPGTVSQKDVEQLRRERAREAASILRACDRAAAAFTRKTDSAVTIRRIREERHRQLCQSE
ncbi:hypothetical protein HYR99_28030 [Candidatus Poribacteria bacterium]|nr:hypothetical protein [Candidatus Poribacteria bacterium]